jgi:hypothetical protein
LLFYFSRARFRVLGDLFLFFQKVGSPESRDRGFSYTVALKAKDDEARGGERAKQNGALVTACFSSFLWRRPNVESPGSADQASATAIGEEDSDFFAEVFRSCFTGRIKNSRPGLKVSLFSRRG